MHLKISRIPDKKASKVIISGEYKNLSAELIRQGIDCIYTEEETRISREVAYHADMQICPLVNKTFVLKKGRLGCKLLEYGIKTEETYLEPSKKYPKDILCNALFINNCLFGKLDAVDLKIKEYAKINRIKLVNVNQGYSACSVAVVNDKSAITADEGLYSAMRVNGIDVLKISSGNINLKGYNTGFIGGCTGLIAKDEFVFTGKLDLHPQGEQIRAFINCKKIKIIELTNEVMIDIGGIIPLNF